MAMMEQSGDSHLTELLLPIEQIEWVRDLYPRLREDDAAIERYRTALDRLPPIVVARERVLVDGFHRWQAHKREGLSEIPAIDLGNLADVEIRREAITRNATHGQQLSMKDKARLAGQLWPDYSRDGGVEALAELLAASERIVREWTKNARAAEKRAQQERAWDLWLDCWTQQAIADEIGVSVGTINGWISETADLPKLKEPPESRQHFDVWSGLDGGDGSFFGRMPPAVVENLLWLYTEPGDVVIDPFAGSGTTIDVAKQMGRRIWASDLTPSTPTLPIHQHDATHPWPTPIKASLILLDPPYWQQAKGRYSESRADISNSTLDEFMNAWKLVVKHAKAKLAAGGRIAFVISPTQLDDGSVIDHAFAMAQATRMRVERRIIVPYQTQQATGQQVEWAREHRRLLKLYRDLVVLR
jgi:DNA methylase/ParB-like nuclease domain